MKLRGCCVGRRELSSLFKSFLSLCIVGGVIISTFYGCVSRTVISTVPQGADVFIDNRYVGKTPYEYSDMKVSGSVTSILLAKDGYQTYEVELCKDEEVDFGAILGGFCFIFPFVWTMGYSSDHIYHLSPDYRRYPNPNENMTIIINNNNNNNNN